MSGTGKIKVLYFDDSPETAACFISLCGSGSIAEVIAAFSSFPQTASLLLENDSHVLRTLAPDVIVVKVSNPQNCICPELKEVRQGCRIKILGLLCGSCYNDSSLLKYFDYHVKTSSCNGLITDENVRTQIIYMLKSARLSLNIENSGIKGKWAVLPMPSEGRYCDRKRYRAIAIGASAGGTQAVTEVLSGLPQSMPPILLVQHLPENFVDFFAKNLSTRISLKVCVVHGGEKLEKGTVYIAGGDRHLEVVRDENGCFYTKCTFSDKVSGHRPSVDVLFSSLARTAGAQAVGVILTGMGNDGAQGLFEMHESGAYTIGQDKETSAVYGMPMVAFAMGAVTKQLPLDHIAKELIRIAAEDGQEAAE